MTRRAACPPRTTGRFKATGFGLNSLWESRWAASAGGREGAKGLIFIFYRIEEGRRGGGAENELFLYQHRACLLHGVLASAQLKAATQVNRLLRRRRREHQKALRSCQVAHRTARYCWTWKCSKAATHQTWGSRLQLKKNCAEIP